jgi:glucokinase
MNHNTSRKRRVTASAKTRDLVLGVDIGGTKVAVAFVDPTNGKIRARVRVPMAPDSGPGEGLQTVRSAIDALLQNAKINKIRAIGLCAPGPLDPRAGVILNPPNVPCWRNFPLAREISTIYGVAARLDNDANAAALAESVWGTGRGYQNIFYATIGTGIGTGIVLDGKVLHGRTGAAGEGGHVSIDYRGPQCGCGKRGCIEALAAGPAIAKAARKELEKDPRNSQVLLGLAGGKIPAVTSEMVGEAYAEGDPLAHRVLRHTVEYLSLWLGNIVDLLEPEVIIMGGGVSTMLKPFFESLRTNLPRYCENQRAGETPILPAFYGEDAGIAGAAALCADS